MRKMDSKSKKITALFLCVMMFISLFSVMVPLADATTITTDAKSYDIAVVFDNSGSMYENTDRWCQAKYAMEIFASMLDYSNGDKLTIFPMWEVTTDGKELNRDTPTLDVKPVKIESLKDIDKISNLYTTVYDCGTPFEPVEEAYEYLKKSSATDRWVVVLTDGVFNRITREQYSGNISADVLKTMFLNLAGKGINIQYLGFGEATQLAANESKGFYTVDDQSASLETKLINICNMIFKRSKLPSSYLTSNVLDLDISMKKMIVFIQGDDAKLSSLTAENGDVVNLISDSGQRKFSKITGNGYEIGTNTEIDKSLAGQVVTFGAFEAGKYNLNYSNVKDIQIFYEPDVDMKVTLNAAEGVEVDPTTGTFPAGTYSVNATLRDRNTDADLTNHPLLGDVDLKIKVKTAADDKATTYENGAVITLDPDAATNIVVEGRYLDNYKISSEDDINLSWLKNLKITVPQVDFKVQADVLQKDNWYVIKEQASWQPIKVNLSINGQPLTAEEFERVDFAIACSSTTLAYRIEKNEAESAYYIYVGQNENCEQIQPQIGNYSFSFAGTTYTDDYDEIYTEDKESATFDVETYSKIWKKLFWVLLVLGILLVLFAIFMLIMTRKVLPGNIVLYSSELQTLSSGILDGGNFAEIKYDKKGRRLTVKTRGISDPEEACSATFKIEPVNNRFTASADRRIRIVDVSSNCRVISINGNDYIKNCHGKWVKEASVDPDKAKPIAHEVGNAMFDLKRGSEFIDRAVLNVKIKRKKK